MAKIMHIITRLDRGGSAQNTIDTCIGLANQFQTTLVCGLARESRMTGAERLSVTRALERARGAGVKVVSLPELVRRIAPLHDLAAFVKLLVLIRRERPDIVHTHTSKAGILGRWAARIAGVPSIIHTAHGHVFYGHFGQTASKLFLVAERLTARITDRLIALTRSEGDDDVRLGVCPRDKLTIVHSGVEWQRFAGKLFDKDQGREALGIGSQVPLIGFIGWLLPIKGPMHLLDAMAGVWAWWPDAHLVFVGKGEQENDLRQRVVELGAGERVHFLGWRDDIQAIMPLFDVFVLPSLNEGMGRVLVEAMAAARPIVATKTGGIPDVVVDGENGRLVPPGDEKALTQAITWVLSNPQQAEAMGASGLARCEVFGLETMLMKLENLYEDLLAKA